MENRTAVKLESFDVMMGAQVGVMRHVSGIYKSRKEVYGAQDLGSPWELNIEGALGELVVARHLRIFWNGNMEQLKASDVGELEVRTSKVSSAHLVVRPTDKRDAKYVLVVGKAPEYTICGWQYGEEIMQAQFFDETGERCKNKRATPMFWYPQNKLRPISEVWSEGIF